MANVFSAKHRVPAPSDSTLNPAMTLDATDIRLSQILPSVTDYESIKHRQKIITQRVLVDTIPAFKHLDTQKHIGHTYLAESGKKSLIVRICTK